MTSESYITGDLDLLQTRAENGGKLVPEEVLIAPSWILHNFHEVQSYRIANENGILTPLVSPVSPMIPRTIQSNNAAYICQALYISQSTRDQL